MNSKRLGILWKIREAGGNGVSVGVKTASSKKSNICLVNWICEMCFLCLCSHLSIFLSGCEQLHWKYMLGFSVFFLECG